MTRHVLLGAGGWLLRLLGGLVGLWPLALIIAFFVSPIGPHLRWEYEYRTVYGQTIAATCVYLGAHGLITVSALTDCPLIALLDVRERRS